MSNLTFNNIAIETNYMAMPQFWGSADPIVVTSIPNGDLSAKVGLKGIQNVQFSNIVAKAEQGVVFAAFGKSAGLSNITLSNISLTVAAISDIPHNVSWQVPDSRAVHDYRPLSGPAAARETSEQPRAAVDGIFITGRSKIMFGEDVSVTFQAPFRKQWSMKCVNTTGPNATVEGRLLRCTP